MIFSLKHWNDYVNAVLLSSKISKKNKSLEIVFADRFSKWLI